MKKAYYIVIEGSEGVGKTTQVELLVKALKDRGYKVLQTKEPGTPLSPLTMTLRNIMLNNDYDKELTKTARELISQAIRSIHLEKVIYPALDQYDFIIQDRGVLSGLSYGAACGNSYKSLLNLTNIVLDGSDMSHLYDKVILLTGSISDGLNRALLSKKEFEAGDAMESKGVSFLNEVSQKMTSLALSFPSFNIKIDGKGINQVHQEILDIIGVKDDIE